MQRPRCGRLKTIPRSEPQLSVDEDKAAQKMFDQYVDVDESDCIQRDELRSILLNLNLDLSTSVLEDYIEVHN